MPENTERENKKVAPVVVALLVIAYITPVIAVAVMSMAGLLEMGGGLAPALCLLLYLLMGGGVVAGVFMALRQRLREIDGGEEEDAQKY